ncbi:DNA-binding transcription factor [Lithospermum erythrorhizon]|uniref:DNA-binding transcription factor n=1 Tax=Lithospermum erythrorhizon TaxID=34254 RepID=A0AAV3PTE2_LITER
MLYLGFLHHCSDNLHYIVMVSIRRRRLLGLCSGRNSFVTPFPKFYENGDAPENRLQNSKPDNVHPTPSIIADHLEDKIHLGNGPGSSDSSLSKGQQTHQFPEVKRRKRHRRKHSEHHEPCVMRGVYFKNMKWQAAIKVDKKQIHLGTVGSQEEAARLYDRAAFKCGREPNFEISEEEKQELRQVNWEDFLTITRSAITNKKPRKKKGPVSRRNSEPVMLNGDSKLDHNTDLSASEDA